MTLIISAICPGFVIQASDSRFSINAGLMTKIYSDQENKSIIFWADDGMAVLGYTGNAYVGSESVDRWLTSIITGVDLKDNLLYHNPGYIHYSNIGSILHRIKHSIDDVKKRIFRFRLEILISGYKRRNSYLLPFSGTLSAGGKEKGFRMRMPQTLAEARSFKISMVGDTPPFTDVQKYLSTRFTSRPTAAEFAQALREIIIDRSRDTTSVSGVVTTVMMEGYLKNLSHDMYVDRDSQDYSNFIPISPYVCSRTSIIAPVPGGGISTTSDGWHIISSTYPLDRIELAQSRVFIGFAAADRILPPK